MLIDVPIEEMQDVALEIFSVDLQERRIPLQFSVVSAHKTCDAKNVTQKNQKCLICYFYKVVEKELDGRYLGSCFENR